MEKERVKFIHSSEHHTVTEINNLFKVKSLFAIEIPGIFYSDQNSLEYLYQFYRKLKGSEKSVFLTLAPALASLSEREKDYILTLLEELILKYPNIIVANSDLHFLELLKDNIAGIQTCSYINQISNIKDACNCDFGMAKPINSTSFVLELIEAIQKQKIILDWEHPMSEQIWPFLLTSIHNEDEGNLFIYTKNKQVRNRIPSYRQRRKDYHRARQY